MSWLIKRSFTLTGHRTSVALEVEFWVALEQLAAAQARTLADIVGELDGKRPAGRPLASFLRVHALREGLHNKSGCP